jgi:hypothetical protein
MSRSDRDFEAALDDIGNILRREGGQAARWGIMMRRLSQRVGAASRHGGASDGTRHVASARHLVRQTRQLKRDKGSDVSDNGGGG